MKRQETNPTFDWGAILKGLIIVLFFTVVLVFIIGIIWFFATHLGILGGIVKFLFWIFLGVILFGIIGYFIWVVLKGLEKLGSK